MVTLDDIRAARDRIGDAIHRTPVFTSRTISERAGGRVLLKCENLQRAGAFKFRGALNAVRSLDASESARGVTTFSSGNHGQALALAAKLHGVRAVIFMPETAPISKVEAARAYGAEVRYAGTTSTDRKVACEAAVEREGFALVPPFDDARVIAGQGTVGLEIVEDVPDVDVVLVPTGGGGLLSGVAIAVGTLRPQAEVHAVEPDHGNAMQAALRAGEPVKIPPPKSIADGLLPQQVGDLTFAIAQQFVRGSLLVDDDKIREAARLLLLRAKLVVEPSGAAGVAALLARRVALDGRTAVVVLTGGNVDPSVLASLLAEG